MAEPVAHSDLPDSTVVELAWFRRFSPVGYTPDDDLAAELAAQLLINRLNHLGIAAQAEFIGGGDADLYDERRRWFLGGVEAYVVIVAKKDEIAATECASSDDNLRRTPIHVAVPCPRSTNRFVLPSSARTGS